MKKPKLIALAVAVLMLATVVVPATVAAQAPGGGITLPISGTGFVGTFTVRAFRVIGDQLFAVGTLVGTLTDGRTIVRQIALPVTGITQATCEILTLVLGPLDLNLLGLMVHLDQVVLEITAEPGPGNLLGNLLCAIAGLLDPGPANLQQLVNLLNRLLGLLQ